MLTLLQVRKLRKIAKRQIRNEKKLKLYLLNLNWIKIRKQKERRKRRTLTKLWKMERLRLMHNQQLFNKVA
jgi:hypothetical protein